ncbi:cathepsin L-like proteinase isoform X1 [Leptinotarsa decemlineata]|uniref:cathepsin L-like proteinase isoform X1 n=1 Tax=Leptinotarsa decemlineata TaxID=7539 RepID=UPI000C2522D1|nr:cathepsin L-like proteinase [Leptinotarsa decemlineata]
MKLFALIAAILVTVNASTDKDQWVAFKQTHGKTYKSLLEERTRFGIFQNNLRTIEEHNAKYDKGEETYYMGVNQFADMTAEEFRHMLGLQNGARPNLNATLHVFSENLQAPESIDWTQKGADLGVKDQGKCGSCWAFSSTGSLEGQNAIHHKVKTPLSEQQLLDCSSSYGNGDCDEGGLMTNAFKYIKAKGIEAGSSYPYQGRVGSCRYNAQKTILRIKGFKELRASEVELKKAVGTIGPISVAVSSEHLRLYGGGVITTRCIKDLDHAVLAVGYGSENGRKYWKIRNSWGKTWGDHGYFKLARDAGNLCGVASMASYPLL